MDDSILGAWLRNMAIILFSKIAFATQYIQCVYDRIPLKELFVEFTQDKPRNHVVFISEPQFSFIFHKNGNNGHYGMSDLVINMVYVGNKTWSSVSNSS